MSLAAAVVVGWLAGGRLTRLAGDPLPGRPWLLAAAVAQLAAVVAPSRASYVLLMTASAAAALTFLVRNRMRSGVPLVGLGLVLNAVVVAANGAMPVSRYAAERAGVQVDVIAVGADPRHVLAEDETVLRWLGDVVPVPLPLRPEVVSPGDMLVAAGLAQFVVAGMLGRPRVRRNRSRSSMSAR